jgi:hypothetical protein
MFDLQCPVGTDFFWGWWKYFRIGGNCCTILSVYNKIYRFLYSIKNTELYTLKGWIYFLAGLEFELRASLWAIPPVHFAVVILEMEPCGLFCLNWPQISILLISASQVRRLIGVSHWRLAKVWILCYVNYVQAQHPYLRCQHLKCSKVFLNTVISGKSPHLTSYVLLSKYT